MSDDTCEGDGGETIVAPSPLLALGVFLAGVVLDRIAPARTSTGWLGRLGGAGLFAAGTALMVGAIRAMRAADTTPSHTDEPPALLTDGVFAYSRNPIYAGNLLQYLGLSLAYGSLWHLVTFVPLAGYLRRVVVREEAALDARFGREFGSYREDVRRWL